MKKSLLPVVFLILYNGAASGQSKPNPGFERLKSLVGEWEGKTKEGAALRLSYRLVSANSAVVETLSPAGESEMVTVYTRDDDQVALTHYCSAGNQPRMRTSANRADSNELAFTFTGATNLPDPNVGHMHGLTLLFSVADRLTQIWTYREGGKPDSIAVFEFTRTR